MPAQCIAARTLSTKRPFINGDLSTNRKNGPGSPPLRLAYYMIACTGHNSSLVAPSQTSTPFPYWSVFDLFSRILALVGGEFPSTATSPHAKCSAGLKLALGGTVISPALKKTKKHVAAAAQTIKESKCTGGCRRVRLISRRIGDVIGNRRSTGKPRSAFSRRTPTAPSEAWAGWNHPAGPQILSRYGRGKWQRDTF